MGESADSNAEVGGSSGGKEENSTFIEKAGSVLEWYSTVCRQKKVALEEKMKSLEQEFYSEVLVNIAM